MIQLPTKAINRSGVGMEEVREGGSSRDGSWKEPDHNTSDSWT